MKLKQILSFLSVVALVLTLLPVQAASFTNLKDTLSSSAPSAVAKHEFRFNAPSGIAAGSNNEIDITLPAGFGNVSSIVAADIAVFNIAGGAVAVVAGAPGAGQVGYTQSGQTFKFALASDLSIPAAGLVEITIGDGAAGGLNDVTNPVATGSYQIAVASYLNAALADEGTLSVAISNTVNVTATVQSSLTFTINGVTSGTSCPNTGNNATVTSTSTTIPFGVLAVNTPKTACQQLVVSTNATNGFITTVQQNQNLTSAASDQINKFAGSSGTANTWTTPETWTSPAGTNHGYFGFNTDDTTDYTLFATNKFAGFQANTTPYNVQTAAGPVSNETNYVSYEIEVNNLQEAGVYTNTLMYICTATF